MTVCMVLATRNIDRRQYVVEMLQWKAVSSKISTRKLSECAFMPEANCRKSIPHYTDLFYIMGSFPKIIRLFYVYIM